MRKITIQIQQSGNVMATRVSVVTTFGEIALHHPWDDDDKLYYSLTHIPTGRAILEEFVIDARLSIASLSPVLIGIAEIFTERTAKLTENDKSVLHALIGVIERMEKALLSDE